MAKKATEPKAKQAYLEGQEPPSIKEIDKAADRYVALRDARMNETKEEVEARKILEALLMKHELEKYEYDGRLVVLSVVRKASVRTAKSEENGDDE